MSENRKLTFMGAINEAIDQSMEKDDNVILIGTDVLVVPMWNISKMMIHLAVYLCNQRFS